MISLHGEQGLFLLAALSAPFYSQALPAFWQRYVSPLVSSLVSPVGWYPSDQELLFLVVFQR
jgi:hypothetical protein